MAELIVPTMAYGAGLGGKYHLANVMESGCTSCGTDYGMHLRRALGGEKLISEIDAKDICKKCLGPLKAK